MRIALSLEVASSLLGSSYDFVKTVVEGVVLPADAARARAGAARVREARSSATRRTSIASSSAISTCCCRGARWASTSRRCRRANLLGTSIAHHRYDNYAGPRAGRIRGPDLAAARVRLRRRRVRRRRAAGRWPASGDFLPPGPSAWHSLPDRPDRRYRAAPRHLRRHLHDLGRQRAQPQLVLMRAPMTRSRTALAVVLALAGTAAACERRRAPTIRCPSGRPARRSRTGSSLISVGLQDLFGPAERQHLTSGFSTRVLMRVALQDASAKRASRWRSPSSAPRSSTTSGTRNSACVSRAASGAELRALARDRRRGDLARHRAVAVPDRRRQPPARRRPLRGAGARRSQSDLRGPAGRRAPLAGAAGARAAQPGRGRQLLRLVRQHLRQPAHRGQRATGAFRLAAVRAADPLPPPPPTAGRARRRRGRARQDKGKP